MKKFYCGVITLSLILCFSKQVNAQVELGLHIPVVVWLDPNGYNQDGTKNGINTPGAGEGFGVQLAIILSDNTRLDFAGDIISTATTHSAEDDYLAGIHYSGNMNVSTPATFISADYQYAFFHNFKEEGFNLYGTAGLNLNAYNYTYNYAISAKSSGTTGYSYAPVEHHKFTNILLNIGLGSEYNLSNKIRFFLELKYVTGDKISFNAQKEYYGDFTPDIFHPMLLESTLGVRFMLSRKNQ